MIAKAIKEEHARPRPLHLTVEHFFKGYPGLGRCSSTSSAACPRTRRTCTACCTTRSSSCSSSPRAPRAPRSSTRTATGCAASAAAASWRRRCAPARRSSRSPSSAPRRRCRRSPRSALLKRLTGLIYFPITPTVPALRPARRAAYLPAKFRIRFLEPIPTDQWGDAPWDDRALVQTVAEEVRARIQEELDDMRRPPPVGVVRMSPSASSSPALSTFWGGRLAQALERDPAVEASSASPRRTRRCELERTEYVRVGTQHALLRRIVQAAEIDTVIDTRLVVDSLTASARACPRGERDRDDEHPRRVRRARTRPCARSSSSRPRTTTAASATTRRSSPRRCAPAPAAHAAGARHRRGREAVEGFAERNPDVTVTVLRFCNALGPDLRTSHTVLFGLPAIPCDPRLRPALPVHPRGRPGRRAAARGASATCRASTTRPPTACSRCRRSRRCSAGRSRRSCRRGARRWARPRCAAPASGCPTEVLNQLRYGRGLDNRKLKGAGYNFGFTSREAVLKHGEALRVRGLRARERRAVPLRARGRGVPALEPECPPKRHRVTPATLQGFLLSGSCAYHPGAPCHAVSSPYLS